MSLSLGQADLVRRFKRYIENRLLWRPAPDAAARDRIDGLRSIADECAACQLCPLFIKRHQAVAGSGSDTARLMILLPAPGAQDERQDGSAIDESGILLDKMLAAISLTRRDVFITTLVKCRPPDDREPAPTEIAACGRYLERQIAIIRPRVILVLGTPPVPQFSMDAGATETLTTHHPAHLHCHPETKKEAWIVLKKVRAILDAG